MRKTHFINSFDELIRAIFLAKSDDRIKGPSLGSFEIIVDSPLVVTKRLVFENINFSITSSGLFVTNVQQEFSSCWFDGEEGNALKLIRSEGARALSFHRCEFSKASTMCIDLFDCKECILSGCLFTGNNETTYGYGIWQGGSDKAKGQQLTVSMCYFENLRHAIDGHYNPNHKTIIGCTFENGVKASISQHSGENEQGQDVPGVGGGNTKIIGCRFNDPDSFGVSSMPPQSGHTLQILDNTFVRPYGKAMEFELPDRIKYRENQIAHQQIILEGNTYGAS